jgi:serine phosphatase RsbU (regulator of sigma subunit)/HAMP domain-containing protein
LGQDRAILSESEARPDSSVPLHKRFSLQLGLWLLVSALLPAAIVGAISLSVANESLEQAVRNRLLGSVDTNADRIDAWARRRRAALREFAATATVRSFFEGVQTLDPAARAQFGESLRLQAAALALRHLTAVGPNGLVVASTRGASLDGTNIRTTRIATLYDRARLLGETELSDFSTTQLGQQERGRPTAFVAAPVFNSGLVVGVMVGEVDDRELQDNARVASGLGSNAQVRVVGYLDGVPRLVTNNAASAQGVFSEAGSIAADSIEAQALRGGRGDGRRTTERGERVFTVWRYIPSVRWGVVTQVSEAEAFGPVRQLRVVMSIVSAFAALLAIIVAVWVARRVARPIAELTRVSSKVARGELGARAEAEGDDEVARLAQVFNGMLSTIQQHTEGLESIVAERTRELTERGARIRESIELARKIESSLLPSESERPPLVRKTALIWRPLDEVGGDIAFIEATPQGGFIAAMIDCTGHGIAAAMTAMFASAMCSQAIASHQSQGPAEVLRELDRRLELVFQRARGEGIALGMDVALLMATPGEPLRFAGAGVGLVVRRVDGACEMMAGRRIGLGYGGRRRTVPFIEHQLETATVDSLLLCSDGILDEPVGENGEGLGAERLLEMLRDRSKQEIDEAIREIDAEVVRARGARRQRDDVTVLGITLAREQSLAQKGAA